MKGKRLSIFMAAIFLVLLSGQPLFPGDEGQTIIAVADFENYSREARLDYMSKGIADAIIMKLQKVEGLMLCERSRFGQIMSELQLGQSGLMNDMTVQKVGRSLSANRMIVGGYEYNPLTQYLRINARVVDVQTGLIVHSDSVIDSEKYADDLQQGIADKVMLYFERSKLKEPAGFSNALVQEVSSSNTNTAGNVEKVLPDELLDNPPPPAKNFREFAGYFNLDTKEIKDRPEPKLTGKFGDFINYFSRSQR
jgi:TolB-like protein